MTATSASLRDRARTSPTVDAHQHYWRVAAQEQAWRTPAHEAIAQDYLPEDLAPELVPSGVDATVLVQSVDSPAENDRLAAFAGATPTVAGVVGWLPLQDPDAAAIEFARANRDHWCGVRCLVGSSSLDWLTSAATVDLFGELASRGLAWDVVPVTAEQVTAVLRLAEAVPQLRIVIDHLARPPLDVGGWQPWAGHVADLAACPGVAMKVSIGIDVLTKWSRWQPDVAARYVDWAADRFGPDRLMLASNWPVVLLRANYADAWRGMRTAVEASGIRGPELDAVVGGTAVRWYRLPVSDTRPRTSTLNRDLQERMWT
jgi:L-fuconolactonase